VVNLLEWVISVQLVIIGAELWVIKKGWRGGRELERKWDGIERRKEMQRKAGRQ
jgi:hypothetical protein